MNNQIIVNISRGKSIESTHSVSAVVVDENGKIIYSAGDTNLITCFRSSAKPFQASALTITGAHEKANFNSRELALICASHNGEKIHTETAEAMLRKLGLKISDYECGSHLPYDRDTRLRLLQSNQNPSSLHNNCSGKHLGMLTLAKYLKVKLSGYIQIDHPVQKAIFKQIEHYAEKPPISIVIDGCSAPTPFYELKTMAIMFQKTVSGKHPELNVLFDAMSSEPYMVAGRNRFDTDFMTALAGKAISKGGGEAIQGIAINTKKYGPIGIALKVVDGTHRVRDIANMHVIKKLGILSQTEEITLKEYIEKPILNVKKLNVGSIYIN